MYIDIWVMYINIDCRKQWSYYVHRHLSAVFNIGSKGATMYIDI
jgi:hypothetical protein